MSAISEFCCRIPNVSSSDHLHSILSEACQRFDVRYFALSHHVDFAAKPRALRVHNYPAGWEGWYDSRGLGLSDPIHRASHQTAAGFLWRDVHRLVPLSRNDRRLLGLGKEIGLGEGVTIPAHIPGETRGSCTFVAATGEHLPEGALIWAQSIGLISFDRARSLDRQGQGIIRPRISDRQRECIALVARGMSDQTIARVLGIGLQTVREHLREARARLDVGTRTELVVNLLDHGELCFTDVKWPLLLR